MGQNRIRGGWGGPKSPKNVGHHLCTFPNYIVYINAKILFCLLIELEIAPTFTLVEERNANGVPSVAITFPNGHNDILLLDKFYANEEDRMIQGIKDIVKLNSSTGFILKTVKNLKNRIE